MAVYVTGDTHGTDGLKSRLRDRALRLADPDRNDFLIICGDCGCVWDTDDMDGAESAREWKFLDRLGYKGPTILFVPGNHENYDRLVGTTEPEILDSWLYKGLSPQGRKRLLEGYPRKERFGGFVREIRPWFLMLENGIFEIGGLKILAIGGAPSHDVQGGILDPVKCGTEDRFLLAYRRASEGPEPFRVRHVSWWPQEVPDAGEMRRLQHIAAYRSVDLVITHDAPQSAAAALGFGGTAMTAFLESLGRSVTYKHWYCGHYHVDKALPGNVRVLYKDVLEAG